MITTSKIKWLGSIILASILLVVALMGGNWGTIYSASAEVTAAPQVSYISPSFIRVGSPDTLVTIHGSNFGNLSNTRVRLIGSGVNLLLTPVTVSSNKITVIIPSYLLTVHHLYFLRVEVTSGGTVPIIQTSNWVPLIVYPPIFYYLPIVHKSDIH